MAERKFFMDKKDKVMQNIIEILNMLDLNQLVLASNMLLSKFVYKKD